MTENATLALVQVLPILMIGVGLGKNRASDHYAGAPLAVFFIAIYATAVTEAVLIGYVVGLGTAPRWMGLIAMICAIILLSFMAFFAIVNMGPGQKKSQRRRE